MKSTNKFFLLSFLIIFVLSANIVFGQGHDFEALKKEYPMLMKRYGSRLESRTAHYIFAIDISSSMQEYESVVRQSLVTFVKAVPDGDQITLIAMSDENNTKYVNSIKCITINPKLRQSIVQTITSPQFRFLRTGDKNDGSDGYSMTRKVLEAMNVVNSSDLTFVYLLTDFEYWTHKNKFDKTQEDWSGLKSLLSDKHKGMMCKYGIELNSSKVSHSEAIFKPELDNIFGPLDYQQANSAVILAQWFGHIINDIRAHKINAMLKADWKEYLDSVNVCLQKDGLDLNAVINTSKCDLVSGAAVTLAEGVYKHLEPLKDISATVCNDNVWKAAVGRYKTDRTWYPSYLKEDVSDVRLIVSFASPYAEEIYKLQGLCQEKTDTPNAVRFNQEYSVNTPAAKAWNSIIPLWVWVLVVALIALWLLCLLITFLINKFGNIYRKWNISGRVVSGENAVNFRGTFEKSPKSKITVSQDTVAFNYTQDNMNLCKGDNWGVDIITVDGPIYNFWRPRGYYLRRRNPSTMKMERYRKEISLPGIEYRVCPLKKWGGGCKLTFSVNGHQYSININ